MATLPPDIEKLILTGMDFATGYGANLWQETTEGFVLSSAGEDFRDRVLTIAQRTNSNITAEQVEIVMGYYEYLKLQQTMPYMPLPSSVNDYALNIDRWMGNQQYYQLGYSQSDIDSFDYYKAYSSKYGDLAEVKYDNLDEYLSNFDAAQQQLQNWINEAGSESFGFTDDQNRTQMAGFQTQADMAGVGGGGVGTSGPEYWETPEYGNMATQWLNEQSQFSSALSRFAETQFPSLQRRFEGEIGRLEPYSSREGAIAEAERREGKFSQWLTEQTPDIQKKYWALRPSERGEKLYAFSPNVRTINW